MIVSNYDILFQTNQHMAEWLQHQLLPTQRVLKVGTHNITFLQCLMAFEGSLDVIFDDPVLLDQFNPNDATTVLFLLWNLFLLINNMMLLFLIFLYAFINSDGWDLGLLNTNK